MVNWNWYKEYKKYKDARIIFERMKESCIYKHGICESENPPDVCQHKRNKKGCEMLHCPVINMR